LKRLLKNAKTVPINLIILNKLKDHS
jgi:hypothetical protein